MDPRTLETYRQRLLALQQQLAQRIFDTEDTMLAMDADRDIERTDRVQEEGGPLNWPPSAHAVAGNGAPLSWRPSADAVAGGGRGGAHRPRRAGAAGDGGDRSRAGSYRSWSPRTSGHLGHTALAVEMHAGI
jgi:hypothetical protein